MKIEKEVYIDSYEINVSIDYDYITLAVPKLTFKDIKFLDEIFPKKAKLILVKEEPLLNIKEKEYLNDVIKSMKEEVVSIEKPKFLSNFLCFNTKNDNCHIIPAAMNFRNLEEGRKYLLEEIGL